jgi:hypothetical protein
MGQYHVLVNVDKKEMVVPHGLGLGLKQYEHIGEFNGTLADAMYILMMTSPARGGGDFPSTNISSRWAGDRVLVLGDYTEDSDSYTDITDLVAEAFEQVFRLKFSGEGWKKRVSV